MAWEKVSQSVLLTIKNFGGFCHGEEFEAVCAVYITIRQVAGDILVQFLLGEVPFQGRPKGPSGQSSGQCRNRRKNVGHLCRPHLALCGIGHRLDEVVDPPLLVASTTMPSSLPVVSLNASTKLSKATFWEPL